MGFYITVALVSWAKTTSQSNANTTCLVSVKTVKVRKVIAKTWHEIQKASTVNVGKMLG